MMTFSYGLRSANGMRSRELTPFTPFGVDHETIMDVESGICCTGKFWTYRRGHWVATRLITLTVMD